MFNAKDARDMQTTELTERERSRIEFENKCMYYDEFGKHCYYNMMSPEEVLNDLKEQIKRFPGRNMWLCNNRLHPDTVSVLKQLGYIVTLTSFDTHDFKVVFKNGRPVYEPITYTHKTTCVSWANPREPLGKGEIEL